MACDFPGHGQSPEPPEVWNVDQFKAQIIALLDEIGAERVDIVAHSFGGRVALLMAAENPERVGRMVLTGCAGLLPSVRAARRSSRPYSARSRRVTKAVRCKSCWAKTPKS